MGNNKRTGATTAHISPTPWLDGSRLTLAWLTTSKTTTPIPTQMVTTESTPRCTTRIKALQGRTALVQWTTIRCADRKCGRTSSSRMALILPLSRPMARTAQLRLRSAETEGRRLRVTLQSTLSRTSISTWQAIHSVRLPYTLT